MTKTGRFTTAVAAFGLLLAFGGPVLAQSAPADTGGSATSASPAPETPKHRTHKTSKKKSHTTHAKAKKPAGEAPQGS